MTNQALARVKIDQLLRDSDWRLTDGRSIRFEYVLDDGGKADYALFDRQGRALAVVEAKRTTSCQPAKKSGFATRNRTPVFAEL